MSLRSLLGRERRFLLRLLFRERGIFEMVRFEYVNVERGQAKKPSHEFTNKSFRHSVKALVHSWQLLNARGCGKKIAEIFFPNAARW